MFESPMIMSLIEINVTLVLYLVMMHNDNN